MDATVQQLLGMTLSLEVNTRVSQAQNRLLSVGDDEIIGSLVSGRGEDCAGIVVVLEHRWVGRVGARVRILEDIRAREEVSESLGRGRLRVEQARLFHR